jgi:hypothetical protein
MDIVWQAEESLKEKKTEGDLKDLLKTLVAFANSVAPGDTATLFVGEKDDGTVQGVTNADNIQKKVKETADKIYPEIYYRTSVYDRNGKQCVRVDVKHNGLAPHFGGAAWVRRGPTTVEATEQLYQQMVELRHSKVFTLSKWLNKEVTVQGTRPKKLIENDVGPADRWDGKHDATLLVVNAHWVTFLVHGSDFGGQKVDDESSEPIEKLLLSWDNGKKRLKVLVRHAI